MSAVAIHAHQDGIHHVVSNLIEAGAVESTQTWRSTFCSSHCLFPKTCSHNGTSGYVTVGAEPNLADHGLNTALHLLLIPRVNIKSDGSSFDAAETAKATSMEIRI